MSERVGDVFIRNFDEGIVKHTLGSYVYDDGYYLHVDDVVPPPFPDDYRTTDLRGQRMPDIPVVFVNPDTRLVDYIVPCFVVRREDPTEAPERWMSMGYKYRAPAPNANPVSVQYRNETLEGYDKYEMQMGSFPYDLSYQLSCIASGRYATTYAQKMLKKILSIFRPKNSVVMVVDSFGDIRYYDVTSTGPVGLGEALDIVDRQDGFSLSIMIRAELDLAEREVRKAVTHKPVINFYDLEEFEE